MRAMHWMVDGYNVIRRDPELASREQTSLEAGRAALCARLAAVARASGERFTVVFDGAGAGSAATGGAAVRVIFSSARESADRVLARLAARGGTVVSNDREVRRAAARAGATAVSADQFLARLDILDAPRAPMVEGREAAGPINPYMKDADAEPDQPLRPRKGNPRRLPRRDRAAARALGRLSKPRG